MKVLLVQPPTWSPDGHANFDAIEELAAREPVRSDVLLLPELAGSSLSRADYLARVAALAVGTGATVAGGSHYDRTEAGLVNRGAVIDPSGTLVAEYDKVHPYDVERRSGVVPGRAGGAFELAGRRLRVLLCADLWYSATLAGQDDLDVVLVSAFSVTRWDGPGPARALWRHMSVARAYEFMTYVAVSDWHHEAAYQGRRCAGVTGFANPCPDAADGFFTACPDAPLSSCLLDLDRLDAFRQDRAHRGFR
ncbi:carbon-nitrogen hydrolase family protein [Nonomuraea sp. NPDC049684]|uniref:carbon-nitrogen hydrolase family protein n=1 Tax=Nonomuraea sp. NPDC049684 TaxID=3364356 RepID=UPI003788050B